MAEKLTVEATGAGGPDKHPLSANGNEQRSDRQSSDTRLQTPERQDGQRAGPASRQQQNVRAAPCVPDSTLTTLLRRPAASQKTG